MSPDMLTVVAAVLVYDIAREIFDAREMLEFRSSMAEAATSGRGRLLLGIPESRRLRSWRRFEKDMVANAIVISIRH
jgi:hypothetical protein